MKSAFTVEEQASILLGVQNLVFDELDYCDSIRGILSCLETLSAVKLVISHGTLTCSSYDLQKALDSILDDSAEQSEPSLETHLSLDQESCLPRELAKPSQTNEQPTQVPRVDIQPSRSSVLKKLLDEISTLVGSDGQELLLHCQAYQVLATSSVLNGDPVEKDSIGGEL